MEGKKILIVEDEPLNMELFRDLLEVEGYIIYEATTAKEGIDKAKEKEFDLILMDVQLPGMDGLTATKIIKRDTLNKDTPIVALTAYAMKGDREKVEEAGCDGYIPKPIDVKNFITQVENYLK
jgi:two-component system cell cycle response regulator DivK